MGFSSADVYVDDELHVPIRLEAYAWPLRPNGPAQLLFEYTYEDLQINVGLTSADFQPSLLQSPPPLQTTDRHRWAMRAAGWLRARRGSFSLAFPAASRA